MKTHAEERRLYPRFPQTLDVRARGLISFGDKNALPPCDFEGRIQNLSRGGLCLLSPAPIPAFTFVCCDITMPDIPTAIPALLQVCWTAKQSNSDLNYLCGLRFVLKATAGKAHKRH